MAAPTYATDLTDLISDSDTTAWGELTGMISGGSPDEADTESALQGTNTCSQATNTTSLFSACRILSSSVTLTTGQVFLVWHGHGVATALLSYASGGLRLFVANSLTDWKGWAVGGNDVPPFPYGKWVNNPIDPTVTYEYSNGTPPSTLTLYGVGSGGQLSLAVAKGQPHVIDIIRYGRAEARISGGSSTDGYATFSGFSAQNDTSTNRWGLLQVVDGGYLWKGLFTIGYGAACEFVDSNKNLFVQDTRKVYSAFNTIEIKTTGTVVDWTGINITCLSPTTNASKGSLEVVDDVSVTIDGCSFTDMNTFIFKSNSSIDDTTFRRCALITQNSATIDQCIVYKSPAAVALYANNMALISNCDFISAGTGHAIELSSAHAGQSYTFTGNTFTGYASSDGTTGNEAIYNNSGGAVTINVSGGNSPTIKNGTSASTTVNNAIVLTLTDIVVGSDVVIYEAGTTTVLQNHQEISTTTDTYGYTGSSAGTDIDIGVFKAGYRPAYVRAYELGAANGSIPISQTLDRYYLE